MTKKKVIFLTVALLFYGVGMAIAQAPKISYTSPQVYKVGAVISPLQPINTGGAVPAKSYGEVSTLAGSRTQGHQDGNGSNASFNSPYGITVDASGNIYVTDPPYFIRKITPAGNVTTLAGGSPIRDHDGQGADANFQSPAGITTDYLGSIYVTDALSNLIRKITPGGLVTTIAGSDAANATSQGSVDGSSLVARFIEPFGILYAVDSSLYISEYGGNVIRKMYLTGQVSTFAGKAETAGADDGNSSAARFNEPAFITIAAGGNIYVADYNNSSLRKITPSGEVTTILHSNPTVFSIGTAVVVDATGNIYFADYVKNFIRKISPAGVVTIVAGSGNRGFADGAASSASFNDPYGLALDGRGNLYVTDNFNYCIRKISLTGYSIDKTLPAGLNFDTTTGIISGTPTTPSPATDYTITAYNATGNSSTVVNITVAANAVNTVLPPNISYQTPQTYALNTPITPLSPVNTGGAVPATAYGQVTTFAGSGLVGAANGPALSASFNGPQAAVFDANGNAYVTDYNNTIRKITPDGIVSAFAGSGVHGFDDGKGSAASFAYPSGLTIDKSGNIYLTDLGNSAVRKITPDGTVSTVAGNGTNGFANGTGSAATFFFPTAIVIDAAGNLFVADQLNHCIRKITPAGLVSTFSGTGKYGSADGSATKASFSQLTSLAIDATGNLYATDVDPNKIRKIATDGSVITIAGNGTAGNANGFGTAATFHFISGIAIDYANNLYIADTYNQLIRKITPPGQVTTLAGSGAKGLVNGIGSQASFSSPLGIAADNAGSIYIADGANSCFRKIAVTGYAIDKPLPGGLTFDATTGIITGTPTIASPSTDYTVTAYNSIGSSSTIVNITVTTATASVQPPNISYQTPQKYSLNTPITPLSPVNTGGVVPANEYSEVTTVAGNGSAGNANGAALTASFNTPVDLAFDGTGNLYITEYGNNDIREITPAGTVLTFAGDGSQGSVNGPGKTASFNSPYGITADASGNLYVADEGSQMIRKVTPAGVVSTFTGDGSQGTNNGPIASANYVNPVGVAFDAQNNMLIADRGNSIIRKIDSKGQVSSFAILEPNNGLTDNTEKFLGYLATDASGNLYVADNNQVKIIDPSGNVTVLAGSATPGMVNATGTAARFSRLNGIAVDGVGNVYVGDADNNLIRKITPAGLVTTLAGTGGRGATNGLGSSASFFAPYGVTVDNTANFLYVTDTGEHLIRKIAITGYAIDKSLPTGLSFDATTGTISGTPAVISPATDYIITAYNTGGSSTTTVNIEVTNPQTVVFSPIAQKTVCDIDFNPGATGNGPVTYTSSNPAIAKIVAGQIHITGAGSSVITASDGNSQQTQTLTVAAADVPSISISPAVQDDCEGASVTFTATATNGGANPVYQWQVNGANTGTNTTKFTTTSLKNNDQITCILTSSDGCITSSTAASNTGTFVLDSPVSTSVIISSSATGPICAGSPVTFTATPATPDENPAYRWLVNGIAAGAGSSSFTTNKLADGDLVTVVMSSTGKCLVNPDVTSNAIKTSLSPADLCSIIIPNTFTPNGDGINDQWNIAALVGYPACTINIFNRYGSLVYSSTGYPKPWDGTNNGKPLPTGAYYYIIDPKNGAKKIAGFVTIIR